MEKGRGFGGRLRSCVRSFPPLRVMVTLAACVIMEATLGVTYTTANLIPYMTSYIRNMTDITSVDYGDIMWVYNSTWLVVSSILPLLGILERRIPNRIYALIGICLNAVALFATYWAIQTSFALLVLFNGVVQGVAQGILYPNFLNLALKWLPQHRGVVAGLTMGGYGGGAFMWNQVVTTWINPDNLQPDLVVGEKRYFTQTELLSRVPSCFLLLGGVLVAIQLVCAFAVIYPDPVKPPDNQTTLVLTDGATTSSPEYKQITTDSSSPSDVAQFIPMNEKYSLNSDYTAGMTTDSVKISSRSGSETETESSGLLVAARPELINLHHATESRSNVEVVVVADVSTTPEHCVFGESCDRSEDFVTVKKLSGKDTDADERVNANHGHREWGDAPGEEANSRTASSSIPDHRDTSLVSGMPLVRMPQYSLLSILKMRVTWTLWLNNLCLDYAFLFIVVFYKAYGQSFIHNDHLLAMVASVASVFNSVGRPVWGLVADRIGYLPALLMSQGLLMISSATFLTTELAESSAMYFAWVCAMFAAFSGIFSLQSTVVFTLFGDRTFIFSLGVICTTGVLVTMTTVPIADVILPVFGWKGIYLMSGIIVLVGILILSSVLLPCGHPIAPHMREGLMVPIRRRTAQHQAQHQGTSGDLRGPRGPQGTSA